MSKSKQDYDKLKKKYYKLKRKFTKFKKENASFIRILKIIQIQKICRGKLARLQYKRYREWLVRQYMVNLKDYRDYLKIKNNLMP